jgi:hypothetical protein
MTDGVPARMFASAFSHNSQMERRHRFITLPLVTALVEPGSRYSLDDPSIAPPAPSKRTAPPKPPKRPPPSSHQPGRPRGVVHAERPESDPLMERLLDVTDPDAPIM